MPNIIIRPNAAGGGSAAISVVGAANHWTAVNETTADGDTSYIVGTGAFGYGLPTLSLASVPGGEVVNSVTVHVNGKSTSGTPNLTVSIYDSTISELVAYHEGAITTSYAEYSTENTIHSTSGLPYTVADVNQQLYAYIIVDNTIRVTQVYVTINYGSGVVINAPLFAGD